MNATHINTEGEQISIGVATTPAFLGQPYLALYDDPPPLGPGDKVSMLLDAGTRAWLRAQLDRLDEETR